MRVFITDDFAKFMSKTLLSNADIMQVAAEVNSGLFDADLGGVLKKRIGAKGISKRDANRSIIALKRDDRIYFIDGWRKADVSKTGKEIPDKLLDAYRLVGRGLLAANEQQIQKDIQAGLLIEVGSER